MSLGTSSDADGADKVPTEAAAGGYMEEEAAAAAAAAAAGGHVEEAAAADGGSLCALSECVPSERATSTPAVAFSTCASG